MIERTFNHAFIGVAYARTTYKRPTILHHTCGMGEHGAKLIVTVGVRNDSLVACTILRSTQVDVGTTAQVHISNGVLLVCHDALLIACRIIQTTNQSVAETACLHIVHTSAVEIDTVVLGVITTHTEAHRAKEIAYIRHVGVFVVGCERCGTLGCILVVIKL